MYQENIISTNHVEILGEVFSDPVFSHEVYGEGFYSFGLKVDRLSDTFDILPVTISERIINKNEFVVGLKVKIIGQIRSYNSFAEEEKKNKLILTIFAKELEILEEFTTKNQNYIYLHGFICKKPIYRTTPFGREIADMLVAVNRSYSKSDYIPCISWGRNAKFVETLEVGTKIKVWGRIQSRKYQKKIDLETSVEKIAYEISVSKMEV